MTPQLQRILKLSSPIRSRVPWPAAAADLAQRGSGGADGAAQSDTFAKPLATLFQQQKEIPFSVLDIRSTAFLIWRRRSPTPSLCPEWSTCASATEWLKLSECCGT